MIQTLTNVFKVPELRNKVFFTIGMLLVFRIGHWVPLPGVNQEAMRKAFENQDSASTLGKIAGFVSIFSGGSFSHSTIFGLGIMPYITAGIIIQLLTTVYAPLKKLQEEGPTGRQKIQEFTRYITLVLCVVQGVGWLTYLASDQLRLIYPQWLGNPLWWVMSVSCLTAGTLFLMWLGEQIDKHGIGNGASMIIMAGILAGIPSAIKTVMTNFDPGTDGKIGWMALFLLAGCFVLVIAGSVLMTVAQRRIPIQQAKHTRGRKVYGGGKTYLPLRINHGGVMPIIFASSIMVLPTVIFGQLQQIAQVAAAKTPGYTPGWASFVYFLHDAFDNGGFLWVVTYIIMVFVFAYFWITVQFNPEEMSKQLKENGSFIPGLRPGPRTAEYLESVMVRVTYVGAGFLAVIAVMPTVINTSMGIDYHVTQFLGGTGLLIVVNVTLDFLQKVEANLLMRNYAGFLGGEDGATGPKMRGPRG